MSALSLLIKKVTIRQFQTAKTTNEMSDILDRTIKFAEGETPYLSEEDVTEIAGYIPVVEPVTDETPVDGEVIPEITEGA